MKKQHQIINWTELACEPSKVRAIKDYTHVRLYHLCRPTDINSYLTKGIMLFEHRDIEEKFNGIFEDIPQKVRDEILTDPFHRRLPRRIDAALDDRFMLENANHYAYYGSETILGLCNALPKDERSKYRKRLASIGQPAIIVFDAPIEEISSAEYSALNEDLELLRSGEFERFDGENRLLDFTVSFFKTVPPEWIVRHQILDAGELKIMQELI